jgi:hypothetical protein
MANRIALISCCKQKLDRPAPAQELYTSSLFKAQLAYSRLITNDIYILSARHGLVFLSEEIEPYNFTLNNLSIEARRGWAGYVVSELGKIYNLERHRFVILAGAKYREFITPHMTNYDVPLEGLGLGEQLQKLAAMQAVMEREALALLRAEQV